VSQENSQQQSQPQPVSAAEIRLGSAPFGKRFFALLAISSLTVLTLTLRPSIIKAARTNIERVFYSKNLPHSATLATAFQPELPHPTSTPLQPPSSASAEAEAQAQQLWTEFEQSTWGASLQDWSTLHPDIPCAPFRGDLWGGGADRQWAQRCSTNSAPEAAHWSFYIFAPQEPLVTRLEQFDVTTSSLPEEALPSVQSSLQSRLAARCGPGEDRSPKIARGRAVPWPQYVRWQTADLEIQLNLSEFDPQRKEGRLRLQARHRPLLDALNDDERLKQVGTSGFLYEVGAGIDKQLADNLRADLPDVAVMLVKQQPDPDPQKIREATQQAIQQRQNQLKSAPPPGQAPIAAFAFAAPQTKWKAEQFHDALIRLLTSAKTSAPDRRPILLFAADRLAWRLPWVIANDKSAQWDWNEWRHELGSFDVTYEPGYDVKWSYGGNLLEKIWTDYRETEWGQRAFLLLLTHGFDTSLDCKAGSDQFRQVIQQGLPFLDKRPKSPYQLDVQLAIAQAYETWWSLSQSVPPAGEDGEYVDAQKYQEGADAARRESIARYEQLQQTAPQSDQAAYARRQLPRLKLSIDTGQRRFYCTVGD
jgi:hypothetical protein